jgi:hypothetical protein
MLRIKTEKTVGSFLASLDFMWAKSLYEQGACGRAAIARLGATIAARIIQPTM